MIDPARIQTIYQGGMPAFVVVPFVDFAREYPKEADMITPHTPRIPEGDAIPHEVVGLHIKEDMPLVRAWREHLGMTQTEVAAKAGISQASLSQMESGQGKLRKATREKLANALGINPDQLL